MLMTVCVFGAAVNCPDYGGYTFVQGKDAPFKDIRQIKLKDGSPNLPLAATICRLEANCQMFNTGGWLENVPLDQASPNGNSDQCNGLYVKKNGETCMDNLVACHIR